MSDLTDHAAALADFYAALKAADVDDQVAGVCTIDLNKAFLTGTKQIPTSTDEQRSKIDDAAEAKRARRAAELAERESS